MKKILFSLVALVCSMSMNAQVVKLYKGETLVATYTKANVDRVVFEETLTQKQGTVTRTGGIEVTWVQLWENGPKFAEYNVGANSVTGYGGYYCWGSSIDKDPNRSFKEGDGALTDNDDTATNLWGSNWRMPTLEEFEALIANCESEYITLNGVYGRLFTGKGEYSSYSLFLPAAGYYFSGVVDNETDDGYYWTSTPGETTRANNLHFNLLYLRMTKDHKLYGYSVRAVLAE